MIFYYLISSTSKSHTSFINKSHFFNVFISRWSFYFFTTSARNHFEYRPSNTINIRTMQRYDKQQSYIKPYGIYSKKCSCVNKTNNNNVRYYNRSIIHDYDDYSGPLTRFTAGVYFCSIFIIHLNRRCKIFKKYRPWWCRCLI